MNYYTHLYRRNQWRNQWLKPLVWAIRNRVGKLHYIERIYDKSVNARIRMTQLSFIILFYFFKLNRV